MTDRMKLSAPWAIYFRKLEALFGDDPEIKITYDEDNLIVKLFVDNPGKADALDKLLPPTVTFGNVALTIIVVPSNDAPTSKFSLLKQAFDGNPAFSYAASTDIMQSNPIHYFVFKNKVVQFFNDDLSDVNGNCSTLYQELAKEVLGESEGVYYCTDLPNVM